MLPKKKSILLLVTIIFVVNFYCFIFSAKNYFNSNVLEYNHFSNNILKEFVAIDDYAKFTLAKINQDILQKKIYKPEEIFLLLSETAKLGQIKNNDLSLFSVLYWVGNDNHLLASSSGKINKPIDLSSRKYLENLHNNSNKILFSSSVIGAMSGESILPVSLTLTSDKGYIIGTSLLSVQVKELLSKLSESQAINKEFVVLFKNNILISSGVDLENIVNENTENKLDFSATKWQIIFSYFKNKEFLLFEKKSGDFSVIVAIKKQNFLNDFKNISLPYLVQTVNIMLLLFLL